MKRVLSAVVLAVTLTACGTDAAPEGAAPETGASQGAESGFPRTVKHAMGETRIGAAPQRVLALDQSFVDAAFALETPVVGYTTFTAEDEGLPKYLGDRAERLGEEAQSVGMLTEPKAEKIAAVKPDLILSAKVRHESGYDQLSKLAPTVFSETTGATWKENLRLVAQALGKEDEAEKALSDFEARAKKIGDAIREKEGGNPTVSVVRFAGEPTIRLYTENSYIGIILDDMGLARPKGQPSGKDISVDISQERIRDLDADRIFVSAYEDGTGEVAKKREKFTTSPLWDRLKGEKTEVSDETWMTAVGILGAHKVLDDMATFFGVDPAA